MREPAGTLPDHKQIGAPPKIPTILTRGRVAHRFDIVPVRIKNEGTIVIGMIMWPKPRLAIIPRPRGDCCRIKCINISPGRRHERHVQSAFRPSSGTNPEERLAVPPKSSMGLSASLLLCHFHKCAQPKRRQRACVKRFGRIKVRDSKADVIEHRLSSTSTGYLYLPRATTGVIAVRPCTARRHAGLTGSTPYGAILFAKRRLSSRHAPYGAMRG